MALSVIPARLEFACGHASLVSLPAFRGEGSRLRSQRIEAEKTAAALRPCDFCPPAAAVVDSMAEEVAHSTNGFATAGNTAPAAELQPATALASDIEDSLAAPALVAAPAPLDVPEPVAAPDAVDVAEPADVPQAVDVPGPVDVPEQEELPQAVELPEAVAAPARMTRAPRARPVARVRRRVPAAEPTPVMSKPAPARARTARPSRETLVAFRVRYERELVLEAADLRAALAQAEALGALEVTRIVPIE
jgi:hypothetical protein